VKLPLPVMSSPLLADLDGDGQADLISGGSSGGLWFFKAQVR
jgi:hypothetical protein